MSLSLFLGPMKSGKSSKLIAHFDPYKYSTTPFLLVQPEKNTRDASIYSRMGIDRDALKITTLQDIESADASLIGIDEIHMFEPQEVCSITRLLERGKEVFISGLDMDYRGVLFPVVQKLLELGPRQVIYHRAVCVKCKEYRATHTQIFNRGIPVTGGLPSVIPENGTFVYEPVCRTCFVSA
jgi:thymidine kinase